MGEGQGSKEKVSFSLWVVANTVMQGTPAALLSVAE